MQIRNIVPIFALLAGASFFAYDLTHDVWGDSESTLHIALEAIVFAITLAALGLQLHQTIRLRAGLHHERERLARVTGELHAEMQRQFDRWGLSPSEKEVALLLIKGLSMREIATLRDVREKTIRQQATGIYAKSGYAGRHELAAHFVEDLLNAGPGDD